MEFSFNEKELLLKEIRKYNKNKLLILSNFRNDFRDNNEDGSFVLWDRWDWFKSVTDIDISYSLFDKLNDDKWMKKILLKNEYGLLGNLLYKYRDNLDEDIIYEMYKVDLIHIARTFYSKSFDNFEEENIESYIRNLIKLVDKIIITRLMEDREFFMNDFAVCFFKYASDRLKDDKEVVYEVIKWHGTFGLSYIGDKLANDKEFMLELVKLNWRNMEYIGDELKNDKEIAKEALKQSYFAKEYIDKELLDDKQFMREALKEDEWYKIIFENIKNKYIAD